MQVVIEPPDDAPAPEDIIRMRIALHRLYLRALDLGQKLEAEEQREAPQGLAASRGAGPVGIERSGGQYDET